MPADDPRQVPDGMSEYSEQSFGSLRVCLSSRLARVKRILYSHINKQPLNSWHNSRSHRRPLIVERTNEFYSRGHKATSKIVLASKVVATPASTMPSLFSSERC